MPLSPASRSIFWSQAAVTMPPLPESKTPIACLARIRGASIVMSASRSSRNGCTPCGAVGLEIATCHRAHSTPDVVVDVVWQVGERDAQRPVGCGEPAAVQHDDGVVLGQPKDDVEWMDVGLDPFGELVADILADP